MTLLEVPTSIDRAEGDVHPQGNPHIQVDPLRGRRYVVHHAEWVYLFEWLGLQTAGAIEPKPGLPPAAGHLAALKQQLAARRADGIVRSPLSDPKAAAWLATETGLAVIELPQTVGATADAGSLFALFDAILGRLSGSRR